ncbi:hypothetical protein MaudCBS49596_000219 [Microsporum audouinii]
METALIDMIDRWAVNSPDTVAAEWKDTSLSFAQLRRASIRVASMLHKAGLGPRSRVPILTKMSLEMLPAVAREGHAIVNVGGSLQFLSRGRQRSSLHRVVPHPNALNRTKYTIVYLMRPETDAAFIDGDGKEWESKDWYLQKFEIFGKDGVDESHSSVLTGVRIR